MRTVTYEVLFQQTYVEMDACRNKIIRLSGVRLTLGVAWEAGTVTLLYSTVLSRGNYRKAGSIAFAVKGCQAYSTFPQ